MRKALFSAPTYSGEENFFLFKALHVLIEELLRDGISVIFDATNLVEYHRERLYNISEKNGVKLILVYVKAPSEVVYQRLQKRKSDILDGKSDADWEIYKKMQPIAGKISRDHFVVDTSRDINAVIDKILRVIKH
jgi:predicted kinase